MNSVFLMPMHAMVSVADRHCCVGPRVRKIASWIRLRGILSFRKCKGQRVQTLLRAKNGMPTLHWPHKQRRHLLVRDPRRMATGLTGDRHDRTEAQIPSLKRRGAWLSASQKKKKKKKTAVEAVDSM